MSSQLIECANQVSLCLGYTCGTIFWIFVVKAIFTKSS